MRIATTPRAVAVGAAVTALAALVVAAALLAAPTPDRATASFPDLVALLAAGALTGCATWGWLSVVAVLVEATTGHVGRVRGVPVALRRAVLVLCGLTAVAALAAPAGAADPQPGSPAGVAGLPLPDRAEGPASARPPAAPRPAPGPAETHRVRPGDSLWSIARHRRPGAPDAALARDVARLAAANRAVIGPDPDLIRPGQRLVVPPADRPSAR